MADLCFMFRDQRVRAFLDPEGAPWWVAADVCAALGIANSRDAIRALEDDERGVSNTDTPGGPQEMAVLNEPGLYRLVFASRKPAAQAFKRWLAHEVLPTLRRSGRFELAAPQATETAEPPPSADYWLGLMREARLTHGRAAAARLWAESPLPQPPEDAVALSGVDLIWIDFLRARCTVTGQRSDFLRSRSLLNALARFTAAEGLAWPGDRAAAKALRRVAVHYRDPETGCAMAPIKRSDTGYMGVRLRP